MWNQPMIPPQTSTSNNNVIQIQMSSFPNQNHQQLISAGLQWRHQKQEDHNNVLIHHHHNNPLPQNYFHPENTTFQALQPSINANLQLPYQPHNWQEPHPSFNGDHHLYYHHNSSSAPITADNNIPYQQHNSELLEAPQPGINGDTNNNNNPHQQQNYSQAPQPSTNNGNDTTKTQTTDDYEEENDANYDTNQFLAD
nr:NAC domain-containing protein 18-like [Ipomoea trifida]